MMKWCMMLSYFLTNAIRIFLCLCLISELLKFSKVLKKTVAFSLVGTVLMTILSIFQLSLFYQIGVEIFILVAIVYYLFRDETRISLFLIFFYEIGIALWEFLCSTGLGVLFRSNQYIEKNSVEYLAALWVVRLLMIGIALLINKRHNMEQKSTFRLATIIAILGLLGVIALSEQTTIAVSDDTLTTWLILSLVLMMSTLFFNLNRQYKMEKEIVRLKSLQTELIERDYKTLSNTYSTNANLFHDMHNHIEVMYGYLVQKKNFDAIHYLENLRAPLQGFTQTVWTGDEAIDYLINSKMSIAEREHIKTRVNIEFPRHTNVSSTDLSAILGNLLDNALEASLSAKEDFRFLYLTVRRINNMLIIKVENGYSKAPVITDNELQTTKKDEGLHGWGLKSVRTAAEKYYGTIEISHANHIFCAVVTLSYNTIK